MKKRGDFSVLLLVFIALFLIGVSLLSFLAYSRTNLNIADARFLEDTYKIENAFESEIMLEGQSLVIQEYSLAAKQYSIGNPPKLVISNFIITDNAGKEHTVTTAINGDLISFQTDFDFTDNLDRSRGAGQGVNLISKYSAKEEVKLNLTEIGLNDFSYIDSTISACGSNKDVSDLDLCLSGKLPNFNINIGANNDKKSISLITKKSFALDNVIKPIEIDVNV